MNKVVLIGRLTKDVEVRKAGETDVARYTLAVDRRKTKNNEEREADFINCVTFGKNAEFAEKFLGKGRKIAVTGRIQTGSYTDKDGKKIYTTDVVVEEHEFVEGKKEGTPTSAEPQQASNDWVNVPDNVDDSGLPF